MPRFGAPGPVACAGTIFLSAFLLFTVQPLIARLILPWFGGSAAVWTTCMLFFQSVLLAGYAYAHASNARLPARAQALLHGALLILAVALLPIQPDPLWKPAGGGEPVSRILLLLGATVGLPYLLLSSTSPLVQAWFSRSRPGADPCRLFAVSNLASLLALIGYPLLVEPVLSNRQQVWAWSAMFVLFALLCGSLALWSAKAAPAAPALPGRGAPDATGGAPAPGGADIALWLALSTTGSVMLLAVTNHITQNIAAIPLLWLAPLTLYLLSFILCFEGRGLYRPQWWWTVVLLGIGAMAWLLADQAHQFDLGLQLGVFLAGLFVACMFCHGELYRARPANRHLTAFYLWISLGGALGGVLVAVVAPLVFRGYYELGAGLLACALLAALRFAEVGRTALAAGVALLLGTCAAVGYQAVNFEDYVRLSERNFYGVLRVKEYGRQGDPDHLRRLLHGTILHGEQYLTGAARRRPTTYYTETSGIGRAILSKRPAPLRVGVIGLGTGTLAAYGRAGDVVRFYDIDPAVVEIAGREFSFLSDSRARVEIALGDARLSLEREPPQRFDVLAVDAFSGDAIPVHLITREALALYLRHLKPDGIVAFHVSNRFLDLGPVVAALARDAHAEVVEVTDDAGDDKSQSDWVLVSRSAAALDAQKILDASSEATVHPGWRLWTDDYNNLVQVMK